MKIKMTIGYVTIVFATCIAMILTSVPLQAEVDFSGENVEWVIPFKEGGGSDKWARFFGPLLSEELPGKPTVIIKNMPGAGSTKGANWFARQAKADGLTIFGSGGSTQFPYLLDDPRVKYDYADWNIVLATATGGVIYLNPELATRWEKDPMDVIKNVTFIYGSQGATRLDLVPLLAWDMLGMKVEPVFGIKGRSSGRLMFERGEVNIDWQTSAGYLSGVMPLVKDGLAVPMMSFGALDDSGNIVRDPTFPDIPSFKEVYESVHGTEPSGDAWEAWKAFFVGGFSAQKMVFLPKGTPQEIIDAYDKAFNKVLEREDFEEKSAKILGVYPQSTGESAQLKLKQGTVVPDSARVWIKNWLQERYNVSP